MLLGNTNENNRITGCHKEKANKHGDVEPAGLPVDQVCSGATLAEPWVDQAASIQWFSRKTLLLNSAIDKL